MRRRVPSLPVADSRCTDHCTLTPFARALLLGASLLVAVQPGLAAAQTPALQYELAAGSLEDALNDFSRQAGITLSLRSELVAGKRAAALRGRYGVAEGLNQLLQGSGLEAVQDAGGSWSLRPLPAALDGATMLAAVKVEAAAATANGSAEAGYRSSEISQVGPWQGRKIEDLPYSMTVLSRELIENVGASNPDQIYRINPSLQLARSSHENNQPRANVRGFMNQNPYRDGMPGDQYGHDVTIEDTERVEVMTGLSGFLYGPGNVGGIINYVSKRPTAERLNRLMVRNNGGGNYHLQGDFGGPIDRDGRFGYRVNAAWQDGETAVDEMRVRMNFISAAFDWHIADNLLLQVNAADRDYKNLGSQTYWNVPSGVRRPSAKDIDNTRSWSQPWSERHYENSRYGANLRWDAAAWFTLRAAWSGSEGKRATGIPTNTFNADGSYNQTVTNIVAPGVSDLSSRQEESRSQLFADFRFKTGTVAHQLTAGFQYFDVLQERYGGSPPGTNVNPPVRTLIQNGSLADGPVYVDKPQVPVFDRGELLPVSDYTYKTFTVGDDIQLSERWSMLAGASYSSIDSSAITAVFPSGAYDDSAVTPSASLIFKPVPSVTTYATYIEALERGGSAAEQFNGKPVVNAGQVMEPMISDQVEVGVKTTLGGVLLSGALFQIEKALSYYDITDAENPVFVQNGRQQHRGLEFTAFGRIDERWSLIGGLTALDARVREQKQDRTLEGKRPALVAEQLLKLRVEYDTPWLAGLVLVGGFSYTSDQYTDARNTDRLPSFTLFDAGARYLLSVAGRPLTLRMDVQNLGDKRYWANGAHVGDPRIVSFGLSAEF